MFLDELVGKKRERGNRPLQNRDEVIQLEKLAALGRASAGILHEIKNPLNIILVEAEFLEQILPDGAGDAREIAERIKGAVLQVDAVLKQLLQFARPSVRRRETILVRELIDQTLRLMKSVTLRKGIRIETDLSQEALWVEVDRNQMQQALLNLLVNAVDAMPTGGVIRIGLRQGTLMGTASDPHASKTACIIEVTDTGMGIQSAQLERVFEPFFTTKQPGKGTGLGLAIVRSIVQDHQGLITIRSDVGKGTVVKIALPQPKGGNHEEDSDR